MTSVGGGVVRTGTHSALAIAGHSTDLCIISGASNINGTAVHACMAIHVNLTCSIELIL